MRLLQQHQSQKDAVSTLFPFRGIQVEYAGSRGYRLLRFFACPGRMRRTGQLLRQFTGLIRNKGDRPCLQVVRSGFPVPKKEENDDDIRQIIDCLLLTRRIDSASTPDRLIWVILPHAAASAESGMVSVTNMPSIDEPPIRSMASPESTG